jgi:hypothetical protein
VACGCPRTLPYSRRRANASSNLVSEEGCRALLWGQTREPRDGRTDRSQFPGRDLKARYGCVVACLDLGEPSEALLASIAIVVPMSTIPDLTEVARALGLTEPCYSTDATRKKLGDCSRAYVYELIDAGLLERINLGRKSLITTPSITKLIAERREAAQAKRAARAVPQTPVRRSGRRRS